MSGRTHFLFTAAVLVCLFHCVTAVGKRYSPGSDSTTDTFGTKFVYPVPSCNFRSFYKLQMVPRVHDPVVAFINDSCRFLDPHLRHAIQYGEMRMGNSSTIYVACGDHPQTGRIPNAVASVVSTREILLHVLAGTDSYLVLPVNTLGTRHTVLSIENHGKASYFVTVTPTQDNTTVIFTSRDGTATTVIINAAEQYIYRSEKNLTGTTVTSNYPIFVVSGMNDTTDPEHAFLEHVVPDHALGKHYVLFVPFSGSTVYVTAYSASQNTIDLHIPDSSTAVMRLDQKGSIRDISREVAKSSLVTVSGSRPFRLLFFVSTPYQHKHRIKPYRLHSCVSVFPVEQYHGDPCYYGQTNIDDRMAVIAGLAATGKAGSVFNSLSGIPYQQLGRFLIKAIKNSSTFDAGNEVTKSPNDGLRRLWFHDFTVLRRFRNLLVAHSKSGFPAPFLPVLASELRH